VGHHARIWDRFAAEVVEMHKTLLRIATLAVVLVAARAGTASARVVQKANTRGKIATAVCSSTQAIVCDGGFPGSIQTDVFVSGEEFVQRLDESPVEILDNLFVTLRQFNSCTQEFSASFGSVPNASSQQSLQSADFQGVVPLKDFDDESPAGSLAVDVSLEGFGTVVREKLRDRFAFEGPEGTTIVISVHANGRTRPATATGTLILDGTPLACSFGDSQLITSRNASRTLEHP
jgi:hypothetical protein